MRWLALAVLLTSPHNFLTFLRRVCVYMLHLLITFPIPRRCDIYINKFPTRKFDHDEGETLGNASVPRYYTTSLSLRLELLFSTYLFITIDSHITYTFCLLLLNTASATTIAARAMNTQNYRFIINDREKLSLLLYIRLSLMLCEESCVYTCTCNYTAGVCICKKIIVI